MAWWLHRVWILSHKRKVLNPYPPANCLFCTTVFGNSNLVPGHLKIIGNHSIIPIKISRDILHAAEGSAKDIIWGISWKSLSTTFVFWEQCGKRMKWFSTCFPENGSYPHANKTSVYWVGICSSSLSWNYRWHSAQRKKAIDKVRQFHYQAIQLNVDAFIFQKICSNNFFTSCRTLSRFVFISMK